MVDISSFPHNVVVSGMLRISGTSRRWIFQEDPFLADALCQCFFLVCEMTGQHSILLFALLPGPVACACFMLHVACLCRSPLHDCNYRSLQLLYAPLTMLCRPALPKRSIAPAVLIVASEAPRPITVVPRTTPRSKSTSKTDKNPSSRQSVMTLFSKHVNCHHGPEPTE